MDFEKLTSPSLRELFVEQLEHMILSGKLKIGEKLPSERQLAEMMQVSRGVVNGGISDLEKKGFLTVQPRSGTYVADYRSRGTIETLLSIMKYNGGRLRKEEVRSILEIRIALDSLSARLCVEHITDEEVAVLFSHTEHIKNAVSIDEASEAAFAFQHDFAMFSGNTLIPLIFQSFHTPVKTLWERFCVLHGISALYENNYTLWTFIRDRNADRAVDWIQSSIGESIHGTREIYFE